MLVFTELTDTQGFSLTQLQAVRDTIRSSGSLQPILSILGVKTEEKAYQELAATLHLKLVDLAKSQVETNILDNFPLKLVHRFNVFPIGTDTDGSLLVATSNPLDLQAIDAVSAATGKPAVPVAAMPAELNKLIKSRLGVGAETIDGLMANVEDEVQVLETLDFDQSGEAQLAQEASVVRLVNEILTEAVEAKASDIHIEAQEHGMKVRYRIDGVLQTQPMPPEINRFQSAIISRLKIMSHLNIAEKRIPQDGRIKLKVSGREIDLRLSIIPMLHGEGVVMRILDKDKMDFTLRGVGMDADIYQTFLTLIKQPHGIILVTGPTGSGKTTTLYSALNEIKDEETKIITTEDPIEYQLDGINQIQVHTKVGLTFAASLRAILRHDPDVVLVGEIRDLETAENAIQASLTGHLVFSTLHTNDAASAFTRMTDMGVEPFLISTTVEGIMAQRLVRRLCPHCKEQFELQRADNGEWKTESDDILLPLDLQQYLKQRYLNEVNNQSHIDSEINSLLSVLRYPLFRPVGCRECRHTGYAGRIALYELLVASDNVRQLASEGRPSVEIKRAARADGMMTLRENGWRKVLNGITSIDEVIRTAKED